LKSFVHTVWSGLVLGLACLAGTAHADAPLRLASASLPSMSIGLLAASEGYFESEGQPVEVTSCLNGKDCIGRIVRGEADITIVSDTSLVLALHAGHKLELVATVASSRRSNQLVARADRGILQGSDLKGRRIGYLAGTSSHFYTDTFLSFHGLTTRDVTLVPLDPTRPTEALVRGEVDAAGLYHPYGGLALEQLGQRGRSLDIPPIYTLTMNLVVRPGLTDTQLMKVLRGLHQVAQLLRTQPAQAYAIASRALGIPADKVALLLREFDFRLRLDQSLIGTLETESRWAMRSGLSTVVEPPDYLDVVRARPLRLLEARAVSLVK
jgi:ABC-type nitrate/sulfonate/bicarbonate transport system substrate-binding protein